MFLWIPESPIWERAADSVNHLFHWITDGTSCCDFFPSDIVGGEWDLIVSVPDRCLPV